MSISYWLDQKINRPTRECDFLIIGSGIAGLSLAYWLEKLHPTAKIIILERYTLGFGASSRNGGFVTCGSIEHFARLKEQHGLETALSIWKFSDMNRELLKEHIIQDQSEAVQFSQPGIATLAIDEVQGERFRSTAQLMADANIRVQGLDSMEITRRYSLKKYHSGVIFKDDGQIHPGFLLRNMKSKIKAELIENQEVFELDVDSQTRTQNLNIKAGHTFLTLNAYLPLVAPEFSKLITPQRGQVLVTHPIPSRIFGPVYITHHLAYLRQLVGGEILIGGFRTTSLSNEETYSDQTTPEIQVALKNYVDLHFGNTKIAYQWTGTMGFTPDHQMMIGRHPTRKNLSLMAGCSGHGMGLSFHAAKILAESYDDRKVPAHLDLNRFRITR